MQKNIFILEFKNNDVSNELKWLFVYNSSIYSDETTSSIIFHIPNARTSKTISYKITCNKVTGIIDVAFVLWHVYGNDFVVQIPKAFNNNNI